MDKPAEMTGHVPRRISHHFCWVPCTFSKTLEAVHPSKVLVMAAFISYLKWCIPPPNPALKLCSGLEIWVETWGRVEVTCAKHFLLYSSHPQLGMFFYLSLLALQAFATTAHTVTYDWSIDWVLVAPDGLKRPSVGINGQWSCSLI